MKIYSYPYKKRTENSDKKIITSVREYIGKSEEQITVVRADFGKPVLSGTENIYVSVTHAENLLLVAVSERGIGIDAEYQGRCVRNFTALAKRYFTKEELDFLGDNFTKDDFLHMWVKKEAQSKLTGRGIPDFKENNIFSEKFKISKVTDFTDFIIYIAEYKEN